MASAPLKAGNPEAYGVIVFSRMFRNSTFIGGPG